MRLTRRGKELLGTCGVLFAVGVLAESAIWVYIAVPLATALLVFQYHAAQQFVSTPEALHLDYGPLEDTTTVSEPVVCRLTPTFEGPHAGTSITVPRPVAAETPTDRQELPLSGEKSDPSLAFECAFPTAGTHSLPAPRLSMRDDYGLFKETITLEQSPTLTVLPAVPRHIHVGQGGEDIAAFGEHETGRQGSGIQPAEIRQYQPGDATRRIDWKATARLRAPHVREFEAESDRQTVMLFDTRSQVAVGPNGRTMLDHAREVGAALVEVAERYGDPLGLYLLGEDDLGVYRPGSGPAHYQRLRQELLALGVPDTQQSRVTAGSIGTLDSKQRLRSHLEGDTSTFATTISPYLTGGHTVSAPGETTLSSAVSRVAAETSGDQWLAIFTSDTDPEGLRKAIETARATVDTVTVFLTPAVLFEGGSLGNLELAYQRYVDFERFRRSLHAQPDVEAYEIAPGDRLQALLGDRAQSQHTLATRKEA